MFCRVLLFMALSLYENAIGEQCSKDGVGGTCLDIKNCPAAIRDLQENKRPQICGFSGQDPRVCCLSPVTVSTTSDSPPNTTQRTTLNNNKHGCDPLPADIAPPKTGKKAWDKCLDYQEQIHFRCEQSIILGEGFVRVYDCGYEEIGIIVGGKDTWKAKIPPNMVFLGVSLKDVDRPQWVCAGTVISERFILTVASCVSTGFYGSIEYAGFDANPPPGLEGVYKIKRVINHPEFKSPSQLYDLALVETDTSMQLNGRAKPACLPASGQEEQQAFALGWGTGKNPHSGTYAEAVRKVGLVKLSDEDCERKIVSLSLQDVLHTTSQMCYDDPTNATEDSQFIMTGTPLQVRNKHISCMDTVIGLATTSRVQQKYVLYTRVAPHVDWVASVVWPDN